MGRFRYRRTTVSPARPGRGCFVRPAPRAKATPAPWQASPFWTPGRKPVCHRIIVGRDSLIFLGVVHSVHFSTAPTNQTPQVTGRSTGRQKEAPAGRSTAARLPDGKRRWGAWSSPSTDSTVAAFLSSPVGKIFRPERRLCVLDGFRVAVALALGDPERNAPEPGFGPVIGVDQLDAPDFAVAVEHVIVLSCHPPACGGHLDAAEDQGGVRHCRGNAGLRMLFQLATSLPKSRAPDAQSRLHAE
jgi:hypothetical protein